MRKTDHARLEVRMDRELATLLSEEAEREHRTLNMHVQHILAKHIEKSMEDRATARRRARIAALPAQDQAQEG